MKAIKIETNFIPFLLRCCPEMHLRRWHWLADGHFRDTQQCEDDDQSLQSEPSKEENLREQADRLGESEENDFFFKKKKILKLIIKKKKKIEKIEKKA